MEFLIDQNSDQAQRRIARHRRLRRIFWTLGAMLLLVQLVALVLPSGPAETAAPTTTQVAFQPTAAPSFTATWTATVWAEPTLTVPPPTSTPEPTATATPTPEPTATATPTATPPPPATGLGDAGEATFGVHFDLIPPPERVAERSFRLAGTGLPGAPVAVLFRNSVLAHTVVDPEGNWQLDVSTEPLDRGENALHVVNSEKSVPRLVDLTFDPWWFEAPLRLQGTLGEGFACAPTVLGMAMDYYYEQDAAYLAPATVEIVEGLKDKGFIDGYGADASMLVNLAIEYGYSHSFFYRSWSQAHLRKMLDEGTPVIANVRVGMSTDGYGHSVLVLGMSPDGKRVMVSDPAQGIVEYPWDVFDRSWASFGPPDRHGLVVKP